MTVGEFLTFAKVLPDLAVDALATLPVGERRSGEPYALGLNPPARMPELAALEDAMLGEYPPRLDVWVLRLGATEAEVAVARLEPMLEALPS